MLLLASHWPFRKNFFMEDFLSGSVQEQILMTLDLNTYFLLERLHLILVHKLMIIRKMERKIIGKY